MGGGSGLLARALADRTGAAPTVADPDADSRPGAPVTRARAESLPFPDETFDAVLFSHVLHHVPDPRAAVAEAGRVAKPTGRLLIRTASHADLRALPHARWIPRLLPGILSGVPDESEIGQWLRAARWTVLATQTVHTPQTTPLAVYAEAVAMQAWRDWALSPGGGPDPRAEARAWAVEAFDAAPPVRETLLVAARR